MDGLNERDVKKVGRRTVMMGSLTAGFALSAHPVMAQTAITTSTEGLEAGEFKIKTADGEIPAYRAMPASGSNFPTILVVQEIFGVHEHIKDVCRRFAKLGYFAVAPELYARQGDVSKMSDIQAVIRDLTRHFSMAFLTTVVGLPVSAVLRAMLMIGARRIEARDVALRPLVTGDVS